MDKLPKEKIPEYTTNRLMPKKKDMIIKGFHQTKVMTKPDLCRGFSKCYKQRQRVIKILYAPHI